MHAPSKRRRKRPDDKLNLTSIMDAIFIFIFFLLMSANFIKVFEIGSPIPLVSNEPPPETDKKPLALTLKIEDQYLEILTGVPSTSVKKIPKLQTGDFDLVELHNSLVKIKETNANESSIIFLPEIDIEYDQLIKLMDAVRLLEKTDEAIFFKDKDGMDQKTENLFSNIVFGNIGT